MMTIPLSEYLAATPDGLQVHETVSDVLLEIQNLHRPPHADADDKDEPFAVIESTGAARYEFGNYFGKFAIVLTREDIVTMIAGKTLATSINGEYAILLSLEKEVDNA